MAWRCFGSGGGSKHISFQTSDDRTCACCSNAIVVNTSSVDVENDQDTELLAKFYSTL